MKIIKNTLMVLLIFVVLSTGVYAAACNVQGEVFDNNSAVALGTLVNCILYRANGINQTYTTTTGTGFPPVPQYYNDYKCDMNCDVIGNDGDIIKAIAYGPTTSGIAYAAMSESTAHLDVTLGQSYDLKESSSASGGEATAGAEAISKDSLKILNLSYNYNLITQKIIFYIFVENKRQTAESLSVHLILKDSNENSILNFTQLIKLNGLEKKKIEFSGQGYLKNGFYQVDFSLYQKEELIDTITSKIFIPAEEEVLPEINQTREITKDETPEKLLKTNQTSILAFIILSVLVVGLIVYYLSKKKKRR